MSQARYTEAADPRVDAAIERTLDTLRDRASGLPGVEAVLLGGSLGRGEGTAADGVLASDVEVYLVGASPTLRDAARRLGRELSALPDGHEVSVAWLEPERLRRGWAKNLSRRPSRTIQLYELAAASRVLAGTAPEIMPIDPARLPLAEGVRLILNRFAEAAPHVAAGDSDAGRWLDKVLIACGDTCLLARGAYTARYRDRATRLATLEPPWDPAADWRADVQAAYERKLRGGAQPLDPARVAAIAEPILRGAARDAAGIGVPDWARFPDDFVRAAAREPAFLRYLPPFGPAATYEGLIVIVRARRAGRRLGPRALWRAVLGRPLSLALEGAAAPLFLGVAGGNRDLLAAARRAMERAGLPSGATSRATRPVDLATLLRRYWEVVA